MFLDGNDIETIAEARNMAPSTIEGHLSFFLVTGEVKIEDLVEPEKLSAILQVARHLGEPVSSKAVIEKLGSEFSYGEVKAVLKHLEIQKQHKD